jgi:hypothetical protein
MINSKNNLMDLLINIVINPIIGVIIITGMYLVFDFKFNINTVISTIMIAFVIISISFYFKFIQYLDEGKLYRRTTFILLTVLLILAVFQITLTMNDGSLAKIFSIAYTQNNDSTSASSAYLYNTNPISYFLVFFAIILIIIKTIQLDYFIRKYYTNIDSSVVKYLRYVKYIYVFFLLLIGIPLIILYYYNNVNQELKQSISASHDSIHKFICDIDSTYFLNSDSTTNSTFEKIGGIKKINEIKEEVQILKSSFDNEFKLKHYSIFFFYTVWCSFLIYISTLILRKRNDLKSLIRLIEYYKIGKNIDKNIIDKLKIIFNEVARTYNNVVVNDQNIEDEHNYSDFIENIKKMFDRKFEYYLKIDNNRTKEFLNNFDKNSNLIEILKIFNSIEYSEKINFENGLQNFFNYNFISIKILLSRTIIYDEVFSDNKKLQIRNLFNILKETIEEYDEKKADK